VPAATGKEGCAPPMGKKAVGRQPQYAVVANGDLAKEEGIYMGHTVLVRIPAWSHTGRREHLQKLHE
jgi:hypothetical protein